ncbi:AbiH family protein [Mucilaginibacter koreensis]
MNFSVERIEDYYEQSFKNFYKVLQTNESFFSSLITLKKIVVLSHSLSKVDMPYFEKILAINGDQKKNRMGNQFSLRC